MSLVGWSESEPMYLFHYNRFKYECLYETGWCTLLGLWPIKSGLMIRFTTLAAGKRIVIIAAVFPVVSLSAVVAVDQTGASGGRGCVLIVWWLVSMSSLSTVCAFANTVLLFSPLLSVVVVMNVIVGTFRSNSLPLVNPLKVTHRVDRQYAVFENLHSNCQRLFSLLMTVFGRVYPDPC